MGITWVADVLSWAHGVWFGGPYYLWIITDLINALQGVFIFIVIGCQPQERKWLCKYSRITAHLFNSIWYLFRFRMCWSKSGDREIFNSGTETQKAVNVIPVHHKWLHHWANHWQTTHSPNQMQKYQQNLHSSPFKNEYNSLIYR